MTASMQAANRTTTHIVTTVDEPTTDAFWKLYQQSFSQLATKAVNRHLLYEHEFRAMMTDPRVDKYLIVDEVTGETLAMCTLTNHLETISWVSPHYFAHHYPDHAARDAIYYLGFSLVSCAHRRHQLFTELIASVTRTLVQKNAMCAYDICLFNNETLGLANAVELMLDRVANVEVRAVDTQTYYTAVPVGPLKI